MSSSNPDFSKIKEFEGCNWVLVVHPHMLQNGWKFRKEAEDSRFLDHLYGLPCMDRIFTKFDPYYT